MTSKSERVPVSVVIPCYRCEDTVERAVLSVVQQVTRPAEVILIDDASPDEGKTLNKLRALQQKYADDLPIEVIALEKNGGPAAARNAGWNQARQPYIAFLDADDSWLVQKLQIQFGWMREHPEVAMSGHICANPASSVSAESPSEWSVTPVRKSSVLLSNPFSTPSVLLKKELPFRFENGKTYAEDFLLWQQIVCAGYPVFRLDVVLAELHKAPYGEGGLSSHLWAMEQAELDNYWRLRKSGCISGISALTLSVFSLMKFVRRLLRVMLRRFTG